MKEPLKKKSVTGASQLVGTYLRVVKNRSYLSFTFMLAICAFPFFAFIGGSADIYITRFGLSEQSFGYFFAFNAVALMLGSLASSWVARRLSVRSVYDRWICGNAGRQPVDAPGPAIMDLGIWLFQCSLSLFSLASVVPPLIIWPWNR